MNPYYRVYQKIMTTTTGVMCRMPELITGRGSLYEVVVRLKESGRTAIMVATTAGTVKRGMLEDFFAELEHAHIKVSLYTDIMSDPTVECIEDMLKQYDRDGCQAMVAIGGGSVIDCAKAVLARTVRPGRTVRQLRGILNVRHTLPDLYAVPTTAGTGSEATAAAVVTDTIGGVHYKYSINDPSLIPRYAVLDPSLTLSLPPAMTAYTGMDALTHAIEAYTNRYASKRVQEMALAAVKLIFENLPAAYEDGSNLAARENLLNASFYAGIAFTNNFVGYVHAVAHALGGIYGLSHGRTNAIILPYVMEQFGPAVYGSLTNLAKAAGVAYNDLSDKENAEIFIRSIRRMNKDMAIPDKIAQLKTADYDEIIRRAMKEANPTYPVPVIWGRKDFAHLLDNLRDEGK